MFVIKKIVVYLYPRAQQSQYQIPSPKFFGGGYLGFKYFGNRKLQGLFEVARSEELKLTIDNWQLTIKGILTFNFFRAPLLALTGPY